LFVTTRLDKKHGWLCCKEIDQTLKQSASYGIELGSLSGNPLNCLSTLQN